MKFRSDVAGSITGIRFYKTAGNTGTHTGTPVDRRPGRTSAPSRSPASRPPAGRRRPSPRRSRSRPTRPTSRRTTRPSGNYAIGTSFARAGVDNPPLHALQGGVDGPNGVYRYGGGGVYPTDTFGSSNYLVDVVFVDEVGPDETAPTIIARTPAPNATGVAVGATSPRRSASRWRPPRSAAATVELRDPSSALVAAAVTYDAGTRTAILDPTAALDLEHDLHRDGQGRPGRRRPTRRATRWPRTSPGRSRPPRPPPPPPDEGPGGPILVVSSAANPFSRYYVEILRNEGLNAFNAGDTRPSTPAMLADYDVVVLGDIDGQPGPGRHVRDWVTDGGNLIAMRPDADLAGLLGLTDPGTDLSDAYLQIDTASGAPGAGLVGETIQFHGTADRYTPEAGTAGGGHAVLDASAATANPAVTLRDVGTQRRPGGGLHLRPRPLGRLHAPGQPGLGRPGARRRAAADQALGRPVLPRTGSTSTRSRSRRPTSSSGCSPTSSSR